MTSRGTLYDRTQRAYPLDGVMCEACSKRPATERHHKNQDLSDIRRENIALLCDKCHRGHKKPGVVAANAWRVWTPEMRAKLSAARMGNQHLKGHKHSEGTKAKMKAAHARRREIEAAELR